MTPSDVVEPELEVGRSLLADLLDKSRLYKTSADYTAFLKFVVQLRNFAPFNAMLLQIQKPGLKCAASEYDWITRFNRTIKEGARPLLILMPFGPVALVYDVADTDGEKLPDELASAFHAKGSVTEDAVQGHPKKLWKLGVNVRFVQAPDTAAGQIVAKRRTKERGQIPDYEMQINKNHDPNVKFATLVHELAHLFLGHLGSDYVLKIADRGHLTHTMEELEAESVSYIVCLRCGVASKAEAYLTNFASQNLTIDQLDIHSILTVAGRIERVLGIAEQTRFEAPAKPKATNQLFDM